MGIQKRNKAVETHILPLQTMQTILSWDWFSLLRFSGLSIIFSCSTKELILFIIFVLKFNLFVLTFLYIIDFIAPLALISILFLYRKLVFYGILVLYILLCQR